MQLLAEIIAAYEGSIQHAVPLQQQQQPGPDGSRPDNQADDDGLGPVLSAVLDPLMEMVTRSAEALSPDSPARLDDGTKLDPTAHKVLTVLPEFSLYTDRLRLHFM